MEASNTRTIRKPQRYPQEIRDQAIDLYYASLPEHKTKIGTARHVAHLLGIGCHETVQTWVRQVEVDSGKRSGTTTLENEEIRKLRRENAELRRANGILKAASVFFAVELDRP